MTPALAENRPKLPKELQGFAEHGVIFTVIGDPHEQARAYCPFCGANGKFYVNKGNQLWDCKVCNENGNFRAFLTSAMHMFATKFRGPCVKLLAQNRGVTVETLKYFGIGFDDGIFKIPIESTSSPKSILCDIHRFKIGQGSRATSTATHGLFGLKFLRKDGPIYLMEGEWDTLAMHETLRARNLPASCLCSSGGAGTFKEDWLTHFEKRHVIICYDNDEAGRRGEAKVFAMLEHTAAKVECIHWPEGLADGYDYRDCYKERSASALQYIIQHKQDGPRDKQRASELSGPHAQDTKREPEGSGASWQDVVKVYRKWLRFSSDDFLKVIFGAMFANRIPGNDPVWLFVVAPAGGAKSEILMSMADAPLTYLLTGLTSHTLVSGFGQRTGQDFSLIPRLDGCVLIVKDFTTILTSSNTTERESIFGILRDAFDGRFDYQYGNGIVRRFESTFGIIAGVTPAIDKYSADLAVLGERFIKIRLRDYERADTVQDVIMRALQNLTRKTDMKQELLQAGAQMLDRKYDDDDYPELTYEQNEIIMKLARIVAMLRGGVPRDKYTRIVLSKPITELGTRLAVQFARLARGIACCLRKRTITSEVMRLVAKVARDTVPDRIEELVRQMYRRNIPMTLHTIADITHLPMPTVEFILSDMLLLGIVHRVDKKDYKLSREIHNILNETGFFKGDASPMKKKMPTKKGAMS